MPKLQEQFIESRRKGRIYMKWLTATLSFLLLCDPLTSRVSAQDDMPLPTRLNLVVVEGEGAVNNVRQRTAREPIIRVEDENRKPIAGAAVAFTLPLSGASGEFPNGSKNLTVMTDKQGLAGARGLKVNQSAGELAIHVTASYRGLTARTLVTQFNMAVPGTKAAGGGGKIIAILAVVAGAAGGGAYAATRKKSNTPTPSVPAPLPAIGVTPGTATIGPPR